MGLKPDLQGGTGVAEGPFLDPRAKETVSKRGQKVARLKSKVVPPGGSSFGPFLAPSLLRRLFQVEADLTKHIFWGIFARLSYRSKKGPLLCHIVLLQHSLEVKACRKPALKWPQGSRKLRPASKSYNFFWFVQFPKRPSLCASCGLKSAPTTSGFTGLRQQFESP